MKPLENRLQTFRQGRINTRAEYRKQLVLRNNLEKRFFKRLDTLFRKFLNVNMYLYKEFRITKEFFKQSTNLMKINM